MKYNQFYFWLVASVVWLVCCQIIFFFIQNHVANTTKNMILYQVRDSAESASLDKVATSLSTMEGLGLIKCFELIILGPPIQMIRETKFKGNCEVSVWRLRGKLINTEIETVGSGRWGIQFVSTNPTLFNFSLYFAQIAGVILLCGAAIFNHHLAQTRIRLTEFELKVAEDIRKLMRQVVHDIRSPLSFLKILGSSRPDLPKEFNSAIARIEQISTELLDAKWGKSREGSLGETNVNRIQIGRAVESIKALAEESQRTKRSPVMIFEDRSIKDGYLRISEIDLYRVVLNLINNAIEASPPGKEVSIQLSRKGDSIFSMSVSDSGVGMSDSQVQDLGKEGMSSKKSGHGIGFSVVVQAVERAGGKLLVESKEKTGTRIEIEFPIDSFASTV